MDEFDPASRDALPSRHLVESDSEDESEGFARAGPSNSKQFSPPHVEISEESKGGAAGDITASSLVVLVGAVGEAYLHAHSKSGPKTSLRRCALMVNGTQQGALAIDEGGKQTAVAFIRLDSRLIAQPDAFAYIAAALLGAVRPSSVIIVDEYNASLYLVDEAVQRREQQAARQAGLNEDDAPLRSIHGTKSALSEAQQGNVHDFYPPNYITGLGASLFCEAEAQGAAVSILLVPREGGASNPHLQMGQQRPDASQSVMADAQPDPLEAHAAQALDSALRHALPPLRSDLDEFVQRRRTSARSVSGDVASMYM